MKAELKAYYLIQFAYWLQQLLVLMLGLEKPRSDYRALVAHHFVTVWLIGYVMCIFLFYFLMRGLHRWSYLINLTLIGNAVYMSMDIPDAFFAVSQSTGISCTSLIMSVHSVNQIIQLYPIGNCEEVFIWHILRCLVVRTPTISFQQQLYWSAIDTSGTI